MSSFIEVKASAQSIYLRRKVCGVGINDAGYMISNTVNGKILQLCPYYTTWKNMFVRCYNKKSLSRDNSYYGCSVAKEWHSFLSFKSWMKEQDWEGLHLDKDIKVYGNKIYSP
ncbi:MAG: hypothetical protein IH796_07795, partial [Deltaproteobacteria bacterium]|nr:hypothetical protein [Deltaproteobacteria bacterium]